MSAHCDGCGYDLPYRGDCGYCAMESHVLRLEVELNLAGQGLDSAANQFAAFRESQEAGHSPRVVTNPEKFQEKADRARRQALLRHTGANA